MGEVTIDSIQIEIESSSTNAAKGIDALAGSLEKLKKSGSFKTVSNNLNNLSTALKNLPNVHSASNSLRTLANSIEKLKGVGSISSLTNSISKLPTALKSLSNINLEKVAPQIQKVADTVAPLSNIKAGGLSSMVNSMKKLGEVTDSLDDATIERFAKKVELLNSKLAPLSEKMSSIKAGFNAINSSAKTATKSVENFGDGIDAGALNLSSFIDIAKTAVDTLMAFVQKFTELMSAAIEWDGISARFGRGFGAQAEETYAWIQRLNEEMGINTQEFMKYSSVYSTMLSGFGVASEDASKMALGYMELTYDIWAGYNDVYGSLEETAEAVKSAIAGEVEPVRRAGFTIVEATLAQTAANHGLEISLANATEAEKSYLRYLTLIDQAHAQSLVGTYAKELNTAEGMMRTFKQQTKSLAQAFGSLFLPALVKIMPWIQAFVELLTEGVYWLANLMGIDIQPVDFSGYESGAGAIEDVANSAGSATGALNDATKAAKELKNATLGIDELNVISPTTATGSGGLGSGSGGTGGNGFAGLDVDSLWDETIFDNIQSDVDAIKEKLRGWMPVIATVAAALGTLRLLALIKDAEDFIEKIKSIKLLAEIKDIKLFSQIKEFFLAAKQMAPEVGWLAALFPKLSTAISGVGTAIAGIGLGPIIAIIVAVGSAIYFVVENWEKLKQAVKDFFAENIAPKFEEIKKSFDKIKEALGPVYDLAVEVFGWFSDVGIPALVKSFEILGGIVVGVVGGVIAGAINTLASIVEGLVQMISGVVQVIRGLFDIIVGIFTLDGEKIVEGAKKIVSGVADVFGGLYDATIGAVVEFFDGVIDWFTKMWDILVGHSIVPDTINAIVEWFVGLPGKVLGVVGDFVKGVVDKFANLGKSLSEKFSAAWEAVKTWWSKKPGLASYVPSIGNIATKLSSAWDSAKKWWAEKRTALSTYTPSIGKIWEKLKSSWENAKKWWSNNKGSLSYTPSIGKIWEKLKSSWENAKKWWSNNKGSMSYTPSIGSIKDKVVSAWNSAKSWWKNNVGGLTTKLNIKVPKLTVNWGEVTALGKTFRYPKSFSLKFAADGGMFDAGSLIWAGERGPEIVANASGGKTGVMNVQQMQDAVYEGVYAAMMSARGNGESGSSPVIKVYVGGKEVTAIVEKTQRERGASVFGNEVYSY